MFGRQQSPRKLFIHAQQAWRKRDTSPGGQKYLVRPVPIAPRHLQGARSDNFAECGPHTRRDVPVILKDYS
jgi:hypothetical protein